MIHEYPYFVSIFTILVVFLAKGLHGDELTKTALFTLITRYVPGCVSLIVPFALDVSQDCEAPVRPPSVKPWLLLDTLLVRV